MKSRAGPGDGCSPHDAAAAGRPQCRSTSGPAVTDASRVPLRALAPEALTALEALHGALGPSRPAFLVGGALRDLLDGEPTADLDVAVPSGAIAAARALADRLDAAFLVLDDVRGTARLVPASGRRWRGPQIDVTEFRAPDLEGDLRGRDFRRLGPFGRSPRSPRSYRPALRSICDRRRSGADSPCRPARGSPRVARGCLHRRGGHPGRRGP